MTQLPPTQYPASRWTVRPGIGSRGLAALATSLLLVATTACGSGEPPAVEPEGASPEASRPDANPQRNAYFGDVHIHTRWSFDAFIFGTRASPDDAYRYAKGGTLEHPSGYTVQLEDGPLDFYAVSDHGAFLGMLPAMADPTTEISKLPVARPFVTAESIEERRAAFQGVRPFLTPERAKEILDTEIVRSAWQDIVAAAERHNDPGRFTTFIAYEYTSGPDSNNLHRNVIFRGSQAPEIPFTRLDSQNPEDLWRWMEGLRERGMEVLAIPHNSNGSNGRMFELEKFEGGELDADYAATRMRNEPLVEITQVKGTSDTHPALSPNDEWADFEIFPYRIATWLSSQPSGSYVREALLNGIELEENEGFNPFRFGFIGSSDSHNAATSVEESNYFSKVGLLDGLPQGRGSVPLDEPDEEGREYAEVYYRLWGASGLAGVWAEENTRDSLFEAMSRKETFATTGPRIRVRFFAGYGFPDDLLAADDTIARAYDTGVPMGADLVADGERAPRFLVQALRAAHSAPLQRLQIVKGWVEDGGAVECVYDVACSGGQSPDAESHRCPENGAGVDLSTCGIDESLGAASLETLWSDPDFVPGQRAFYYARVLENPTCRWSTWDAIRAGVAPHPDLPATLQERAWSSPIWYVPAAAP